MNSKEKYYAICQNYDIPLFGQYWWMNAVCNNQWDVFIYEEYDKPIASLVYFLYRKYGFNRITQPIFTQTNGLWINYENIEKEEDKFKLEAKVFSYFYHQISLQKVDFFQQAFHYSVPQNYLSHWGEYKQTERQTFVIEDISDIIRVKSSFSKSKKKHLAKAKNLVLINDVSALQFYEHHRYTLKAKGKKISYTLSDFERIFDATVAENKGQIIAVGDENGTIFAALFIIWDHYSAYNLISTIDLKYKNTGASTLVVVEAIEFVSNKTQRFDFEGSMIPEVAYSFRQFGTTRKPFFQLEKQNSQLFRVLMKTKSLLR